MGRGREVVAVLERDDEDQVVSGAAALADMLDAAPVPLRVGAAAAAAGAEAHRRAAVVLDALSPDHVVGAVLRARQDDALLVDVATGARVPLLVIPAGVRGTISSLRRVLVPLDGSAATAAEVRPLVGSALDAGADVVAVHVFDTSTTPAFWDQAAHSHRTWTREFMRRHGLDRVRLDLRRGQPVVEVLAEAGRGDVDVVLLGWGQDLGIGRAPVVRALLEAAVPLLLTGAGPGTNDRRGRGPSSLAPGPAPR